MPPKLRKKPIQNSIVVIERKPIDLQEIAKRQASKINRESESLNRSNTELHLSRKQSHEPRYVNNKSNYDIVLSDLSSTPTLSKSRTSTPAKPHFEQTYESSPMKMNETANPIFSNSNVEILAQNLALKYKKKYKKQAKELVNRQNEIHNFQMESMRRLYEEKLKKYREIIIKLQKDNEDLLAKNMNSEKIIENPTEKLEEENLWLKKEIQKLKAKTYHKGSEFTLGRIPDNLYSEI
ncbi:unnamed protein product [Blepharisma stoltei]|uniref:Uncharacterized protein n=1 Tax=Blepharisma stoltei TaxID=1481888 RepID=A0AAU9JXU9_9CILI|nr:unnamed protein product [Blepharisma stoltei]